MDKIRQTEPKSKLDAWIPTRLKDKLQKLANRDTEGNLSQMVRKLVENAK
jgi:hypothetical protein